MRHLLLILLATGATAAPGAIRPTPGSVDPRIQSVLYDPGQVVVLEGAPGFEIMVEFGSDERIESVAVGDSASWQISSTKNGGHLFIKPASGGVATNMTVVTDSRSYAFELQPASGDDVAPFMVRFRYPAPPPSAAVPVPTPGAAAEYRVSGASQLRPASVRDDGLKTYLRWRSDQPLPAVYGVDAAGRETLVNGGMRDGTFVVDGVFDRLIFRADRWRAAARRVVSARASRP